MFRYDPAMIRAVNMAANYGDNVTIGVYNILPDFFSGYRWWICVIAIGVNVAMGNDNDLLVNIMMQHIICPGVQTGVYQYVRCAG